MSDSTNAILQQAHELIESNQHDAAQELLAPLLEAESENPAFWWVYAHAVSDSVLGDAALDRVLQLDPTYPGARELKADVLEARSAAAKELESGADLLSGSVAFAEETPIDDWEALKPELEQASESSGTGRGFVLLIVALLIGASGLLLVLSGVVDLSELQNLFSQATIEPVVVVSVSTATSTQLPADAAEARPGSALPDQSSPIVESNESPESPSETPPADPTSDATATAPPEPATVSEFIALIASSVSGFEIDTAQSSARETSVGETLDILVCTAPGEEFTERLNGIMNGAVDNYLRMPTDMEAFAVSLVNCSDPNATARTIGVVRDTLDAFVAGDIDRKTFQQAWQALS